MSLNKIAPFAAAAALLTLFVASLTEAADEVMETGRGRVYEENIASGSVLLADSLSGWTSASQIVIVNEDGASSAEIRLNLRSGGLTSITIPTNFTLNLPIKFERFSSIDTVLHVTSGTCRIYLVEG